MPAQNLDHTEATAQDEHFRDVRTLLAWHAPARPFQKRKREYFINIFLLVLFLEVILLFFSQFFLMLVILSLAFLAYALATVPPHDYYYKLSNQGVMVDEHFFLWQELYDFYFKKTDGAEVLHIGTKAYYPGEILLVLGEMSVEHVKSLMLQYLPYREYVRPTFQERAGEWLAKTFPLERSTP